MKIAVKKLSELLKSSVEVPVFEYKFPEGIVGSYIVVNEASFDEEQDEAEYTVNIHGSDMENIEMLADKVLPLFEDLWEDDFNGWTHKRQLSQVGDSHCLTITLIIQFN